MAIEEKSDGRTVQLKRMRLSFTESLKDKKATVADGTPKHSFNAINEKSNPHFEENRAKILSAMGAACDKEFKDKERWKSIAEDDPKRVCYRKGERFKNAEGKVYAGYEGNFALALGGPSGGQKRPKLFDRYKRVLRSQASAEQLAAGKVFEESEILDIMYGGTYADVIVSFYGTKKGGPGVFASGDAIRSHQEGDRMGGGGVYVDADDFDNLEDDDSFDKGPATGGVSKNDDVLDF